MLPRVPKTAALAVAVGVAMAACTSSGAGSRSASGAAASSTTSARSTSTTSYRAGDFSANVDNRWFPLKPGTTLVYRGTKDEGNAVEYLTVSDETQKVGGVPCRAVLDRLYLDGTMVSTEGTWHTAEAGAQPGIFMPASPRVGESHRQEYYRGHAEDFFQVLDLTASVSVPYKSFSGTLQTKEWTPLEPDVRDNKYYVQGIGEVKETTVKGPREELVLVDVKND